MEKKKKVLSELNVKLNKNTFNLILHPIYLFDGFLYKNVCNKFKKKFKKINILEPLSNNKEILELVQNKLLGGLTNSLIRSNILLSLEF